MNVIMGAAKPLVKEINHYLEHLSTEQRKVVLSVVKSFAREEEAWADDKTYIAEMERRSKELETGKVKGLQLEDLAARAIKGKRKFTLTQSITRRNTPVKNTGSKPS